MARNILPVITILLLVVCVVDGGGGNGGHDGWNGNSNWESDWGGSNSQDDDQRLSDEEHQNEGEADFDDESGKDDYGGDKDAADDEMPNAGDDHDQSQDENRPVSKVSPPTTVYLMLSTATESAQKEMLHSSLLKTRNIAIGVVIAAVVTIASVVIVVAVVRCYMRANVPRTVTPDANGDLKLPPPAYDVTSGNDEKKGELPHIVPFNFEGAPPPSLYPPSYSSINVREEDGNHMVVTVQPAEPNCYGKLPKY